MTDCNFPKTWLMLWLDDELDPRAEQAREHLKHCQTCAAQVDAWRKNGAALRTLVDKAVGEVEPLWALERIHARIEATQELPWFDRFMRAASELLLLNRRRVAGLAAAAAMGMLVAPAVVYFAGRGVVPELTGPTTASVVVESLEVGDGATAVVLGSEEGGSTLIWIETDLGDASTDEKL